MKTKTDNQLLHHEEQMAAARAQFAQLWDLKIKPASFMLDLHKHLSDQDYVFVEHLCWLAFREGKGVE